MTAIPTGSAAVLPEHKPANFTPITAAIAGTGNVDLSGLALGRTVNLFADAAVTVAVLRQHQGGSGFYPVGRSDGTPVSLTIPTGGGYAAVPWIETEGGATVRLAVTGAANVRAAQ